MFDTFNPSETDLIWAALGFLLGANYPSRIILSDELRWRILKAAEQLNESANASIEGVN